MKNDDTSNIEIAFINGRFNGLADAISRTYYSVYLQSPEPHRNELVDRITIPLDKTGLPQGARLSADQLYEFLMADIPSRLVPCQKNVPRLYQVTPQQLQKVWGGVAPECQFLWALRATCSHDARVLKSGVLREFLLALEKDRAPKDLLQKFREGIMSHQLKGKLQMLREAYPLSACGEDALLNRLQTPCPDITSPRCSHLRDPLKVKFGNKLEMNIQRAREKRKEVDILAALLGIPTSGGYRPCLDRVKPQDWEQLKLTMEIKEQRKKPNQHEPSPGCLPDQMKRTSQGQKKGGQQPISTGTTNLDASTILAVQQRWEIKEDSNSAAISSNPTIPKIILKRATPTGPLKRTRDVIPKLTLKRVQGREMRNRPGATGSKEMWEV